VADATLLAAARKALRVVTTEFDDEIGTLLDAAFLDMGVAGVAVPITTDALVERAAITYVKCNFGEPDDYDRLKRSYDEQKAQLVTATGYTDWLMSDG